MPFITFEGGEGSGKSTQVELLRAKLTGHGRVLTTREPGGCPGAEEIRKLLVTGDPEKWCPLAEAFLFMAARAEHVEQLIRPALKEDYWVISDRYMDSSYVYQGIARGVGVSTMRRLQAYIELEPNLTFVLDIPPEIGLKRAGGRRGIEDRFEKFDAAFHGVVRMGFRSLTQMYPRCKLIDASGEDRDAIGAIIWNEVRSHFGVDDA